MERRTFLASGLAAAVAAPALGVGGAAWAGRADRVIPSSGQSVPSVGLGTWITFNVGADPVLLEECAAVVAAFVDDGGGMIDSSPMYGSSQNTVGYGLERLGRPANVFSADKVWTGSVSEGPEQIARSAAEWGIGSFDLLQVHNLVEWRGHLETLFAMKSAGKLGHVGITTSHGRRHDELERIMREHPIDSVQLTYNIADREAEGRLLPLAREKGVAVIVNRPFRQGALTRRLAGEPLPPVAAELGASSWTGNFGKTASLWRVRPSTRTWRKRMNLGASTSFQNCTNSVSSGGAVFRAAAWFSDAMCRLFLALVS